MEKEIETKWKNSIDENLRMGFLELMILHMLQEKDMYGYEIKKELSVRTRNKFAFGEGSLYIPLVRMAKRGLVSSYKEHAVGKRYRTYYHIEEEGVKYLEYGKKQMRLINEGVNALFKWDSSVETAETTEK